MKQKLRSILSLSAILPISCAFAATTIACAVLNSQNSESTEEEHNEGEIKREFLDLSPDGDILYGLSPKHTVQEIVDEGFTTLSIPEGVKEISNYAFANIFGSTKTEKVQQIILPNSIEKIGTGAFLNCTAFKSGLDFSHCNKLTTIGDEAFNSCSNLVCSIDCPNTLRYIGDSAFRYCGCITGISINPQLETVKYRAFADCEAFNSINLTRLPCISKWMYQEGQQIFAMSGTDITVTVGCKNNTIDEWNDVLFSRLEIQSGANVQFLNELPESSFIYGDQQNPDTLTQIQLPALNNGEIDLIRVPEHTTVINEDVFKNIEFPAGTKCKIILGTKLTEIKDRAFKGCSWIDNEINLPTSLTKIGNSAFEGSSIKGTVNIPKGITNIGNAAFKNCSNLYRVNFGMVDTKTFNSPFGDEAFSGCTHLSCLDFSAYGSDLSSEPQGLPKEWFPEIDEGYETTSPFYGISPYGYFFVHTTNGKTAGIDRWEAFFNEEEGQRIFPEDAIATETRDPHSYDFNVDNDKKWIISELTATQQRQLIETDDLVISRGVDLIGLSHSFIRKTKFRIEIDELDVPSRIQTISKNAFYNAFLPKTVDNDEHYDEQKYYTLTFHNGLIKINDYAFADCPGFAGMFNFPNSLEYIGDYAFSQCVHMRGELILPRNIQNIGSFAFFNCIGIANDNLNIPESTTKIGMAPFHGIKASKIILPYKAEEIGDYAFEGINDLSTIDLTSITDKTIQGKPSDVYKWSKLSFAGLNPSGGTIYANNFQDFIWANWLHDLGLPSSWTVQVQ